MDYEKLKALTVAETEARTQEMLAAERMRVAKEAYDAAAADWKVINERYNAAKGTRESYIAEAIRQDAKAEFTEHMECA